MKFPSLPCQHFVGSSETALDVLLPPLTDFEKMLREADQRIREAVDESMRLKKQLQETEKEWRTFSAKEVKGQEAPKGRTGLLSEQEEELAELERLPQDSEIYRYTHVSACSN